MPLARALSLAALSLTLCPAAVGDCPAVTEPPADRCLGLEITVKNVLPVPLEWWSVDCADGGLLVVKQDGSGYEPLPARGDMFIPAHGERKLFVWAAKVVPGCVLAELVPPAGTFVVHVHEGEPTEIITLYYANQRESPVHSVLAPFGWEAPGPAGGAAGSDYWGWNISEPASHWDGASGTSSVTCVFAGCPRPEVPRHGENPPTPATAEKNPAFSRDLECVDYNCGTIYNACCWSQAEYKCDTADNWELSPATSDPAYAASVCTAGGTWSNPQKCTTDCGSDPEDLHAIEVDGDYLETYTCKRGFELQGLQEPHSCPPSGQHCSHPQPAYNRQCDRTDREWRVIGNKSTGMLCKVALDF